MASLPITVFHFCDTKNAVALHLNSFQQRITILYRLGNEVCRYLKPAYYGVSCLNFSNACIG